MSMPLQQKGEQTAITPKDDDAWQWAALPESKRLVAQEREIIVKAVIERMETRGEKSRFAIECLLAKIESGGANKSITETALRLGKKGKPPVRSTLSRWLKLYKKGGAVMLAPGHKGGTRKDYGWELRAEHLYRLPSKPDIAAVEMWLRQEHFKGVTYSRVHRYLKSLPAERGANGRGRLGPRLYDNTQKSFVRRNTAMLEVGSVYQGDGHTIDVYLQHPTGRKPWRAELTLWIDIRSRYVVGWYISEAESAHSTLFALSHAMLSQDHIPAVLHIDNGSGYKNKMMSDESTGFYDRFGITVMHSRPYNAKGKGQVERFFGTMERQFGKKWPSYCGADMDDEAIQLLLKKYKKGEAELPSLAQYIDGFKEWLNTYHNEPHRGLDGKTPAQVWADLKPHNVKPKAAAIFWPRTKRTVSRQSIRLDNREYMAPELISYNGKTIHVEHNIHDDSFIRCLLDDGRWICDAKLVHKADYMPSSRLDEAKQKRLKSQIKRLEVHIDEQRERAGLAITHEDQLEIMNADHALLTDKGEGEEFEVGALTPTSEQDVSNELRIDLTDTNY